MSATTDEPIYQRVCDEQQWTPEQLRPPFQLGDLISASYQRAMVRAHLRQQIAYRQRARRNRHPRTTPLP